MTWRPNGGALLKRPIPITEQQLAPAYAHNAELPYDERITDEQVWAEAGWATTDEWTSVPRLLVEALLAGAYRRLYERLRCPSFIDWTDVGA